MPGQTYQRSVENADPVSSSCCKVASLGALGCRAFLFDFCVSHGVYFSAGEPLNTTQQIGEAL